MQLASHGDWRVLSFTFQNLKQEIVGAGSGHFVWCNFFGRDDQLHWCGVEFHGEHRVPWNVGVTSSVSSRIQHNLQPSPQHVYLCNYLICVCLCAKNTVHGHISINLHRYLCMYTHYDNLHLGHMHRAQGWMPAVAVNGEAAWNTCSLRLKSSLWFLVIPWSLGFQCQHNIANLRFLKCLTWTGISPTYLILLGHTVDYEMVGAPWESQIVFFWWWKCGRRRPSRCTCSVAKFTPWKNLLRAEPVNSCSCLCFFFSTEKQNTIGCITQSKNMDDELIIIKHH